MSKDNRDLLVGLDIGTSKVVALVAELEADGQFNVVGVGQTASKGLKKGVVVNIEATVQSIQKALEEAESEKGEISLYEQHIISYIENIIQNEKELPIEEADTQDQLVIIEALKSKNKVKE